MPSRRPTMSDVARLAGVGTMSVSRFLNSPGRVSPEAGARIQGAVERLDYRLNEVARSLRGRRSRMIGIILPNISDPFFATCAHAIDRTAKAHGYMVAIASSTEDSVLEEKEALALVQRNVDGLIVAPANSAADYFAGPQFASTPVVFLDRLGADRSRDSVLVQNEQGVRLGLEHLLAQGYKRIAFLGAEQSVQTMSVRYEAYARIMRSHGLQDLPYIFCPVPAALDDALLHLLQATPRPSAIFTAHSPSSRALLASMRRLGLQTPRDIGLVGFDDFETAELLGPGITVVSQPVMELGRISAELLFERLLSPGGITTARHPRLPMELTVRGSSAPRLQSDEMAPAATAGALALAPPLASSRRRPR